MSSHRDPTKEEKQRAEMKNPRHEPLHILPTKTLSGITHSKSIGTALNPWHRRKASFRNWQNSVFQAEGQGLGWLQNSLFVTYYTACSTRRRGKPAHNWHSLFYFSVYTFINTWECQFQSKCFPTFSPGTS